MTNQDWWDLGVLPMEWSIYDRSNGADLGSDTGEWVLDLRAEGVEDGTHDVLYGNDADTRVAGVEVKGGEFVPEPTAEACYKAVCLGYYEVPRERLAERRPIDHVFIEQMTWDGELGAFMLSTGS